MVLADVMTRDVKVIQPDRSICEAAQLMDQLNVGSIPVCNGEKLVGVITDRDITVRATAAGRDPQATRVADVMTNQVRWCQSSQNIDDAVQLMGQAQIRRLPVVNDDMRLVGIVSLGDLATEDGKRAEVALREISEPSEPDR
jgi:CBS domain-containing protein